MKRLLVCACLCVAMSFATLAQRPATDSVERYVSDFARLGKLSAKNPASVEALYGYAMFYFDNSHPLRNLPLAMIYIRQAEERHLALLQGTDMSEVGDLARKGITISSLRQAKQAIATAAQNTVEVRTDMTAKEIDAYLEVFGNDEQMVRMLRERRFTQVYNDDLAIGTAESYYHFIESYPGTTEAGSFVGRKPAYSCRGRCSGRTLCNESVGDACRSQMPQQDGLCQSIGGEYA